MPDVTRGTLRVTRTGFSTEQRVMVGPRPLEFLDMGQDALRVLVFQESLAQQVRAEALREDFGDVLVELLRRLLEAVEPFEVE
ncbi:MAG: hypothetical protein HYZ89_08650 [Candidatus Omnitrophica bacterium]|nr:hypothetical protein [Candidatus Omnitrophota bacterium]